MVSGSFGFNESDCKKSALIGDKPYIIVQNSQVEIEAGFENPNISIIEGGNMNTNSSP